MILKMMILEIIEEMKEYDLIAKTGDEKEVIATYESDEEAQEALNTKVMQNLNYVPEPFLLQHMQ